MKTLWLVIFFAALIWSAIAPKDTLTWFLEVFPALLGLVILVSTYKTFPLTPLVYVLILFHCVVLMVGGHYTYAEVPLFDFLKDLYGGTRNNYDKLGHFLQGFVPVLIAREIFIRKSIVKPGGWLGFLSVACCLAFSAFYELVEWQVALLSHKAADAFLGTQGYMWDTQSDMGFALIGSVTSLVLLSREHNRQIAVIGSKSGIS